MNTENQVREMRRAYQAPAMTLVQLRPEEAVLSNCKVGTTNGPHPLPGNCTTPGNCSTLGS